VVSEEGQRAEMRDEDDDLLRAAEELGIDLSGVRATDGGADEQTESEDDTDAADEAEADADTNGAGDAEEIDAEALETPTSEEEPTSD
jgi:DNA-directed RNA polymerase subunit beta